MLRPRYRLFLKNDNTIVIMRGVDGSREYNNTSVVGGHVGVELFSGNNSLLATGLLGGAVFGPVSLSVAPEPNPFLVIAGGLVSVVFIERMIVGRSRKERRAAKS
jgi:hypothetical protein